MDSYHLRWAGTCAVVTFPAEVDITGAGEMRERLLSVIGQGATTLIIDLSAVTFCDSAGVNAIVRAYRRANAAGSQLRLVITSTSVRRVFDITEVDRLIPVFGSLGEALAGLVPEDALAGLVPEAGQPGRAAPAAHAGPPPAAGQPGARPHIDVR